MQHINSERVTYLSFLQEGEYYIGCTNDGCTNGTTKKAEALFVCLGYSASEYGNGSIAVGFSVNNTAINEYTRITGKGIEYGIFAASYELFGAKDVVNADGSTVDGAITFDITGYNHDAFEIKIVGLTTEEHKTTELVFGAYVIVNNEDISYIQVEAPNEGEKYYYTTYNDIVALKA